VCTTLSCELSSARLVDVKLVDPVTEGPIPRGERVFAQDTQAFLVTALLKNAPEGTEVKIRWYYLEEGEDAQLLREESFTADPNNTINQGPPSEDRSQGTEFGRDGMVSRDGIYKENGKTSTWNCRFSLSKPNTGWRKGRYRVFLRAQTDYAVPENIQFAVK
jgi:hypothetical protein